jgi:Spy/CpxP family protein refolding chaperone
MNAGAWRGLVITIVLALAAGFIGAKLGAMGAHPAGGATRGSVRQSVDSLLAKDFRLTPEQKRQVEDIDERFTKIHNVIWADINTSNARLASAVATDLPTGKLANSADMTLSPDAKASIEGIEQGVGKLHTESILYVLQVRDVLTPEQRRSFDEHIIMALMRSPP